MSAFRNILSAYGFDLNSKQDALINLLFLAGCFEEMVLKQDLEELGLEESNIQDALGIVKKSLEHFDNTEINKKINPHIILDYFLNLIDSHQNVLPDKLHQWLVKVTQRSFFARKIGQERWQMNPSAWMKQYEKEATDLCNKLGLADEVKPKFTKYKLLGIFGATSPEIQERLKHALEILNDKNISIERIALFTGHRLAQIQVDGDEARLKTIAQKFSRDLTELYETQLFIFEFKNLTQTNENILKKPLTVVDTPFVVNMKGELQRPTTIDTLIRFSEMEPDFTGPILFISRAPNILAQREDTLATLNEHLKGATPDVIGAANSHVSFDRMLGALGGALYGGYVRVAHTLGSQKSSEELLKERSHLSFNAPQATTSAAISTPNHYRLEFIFKNYLVDLVYHYKTEISWFADPHVAVTSEASGGKQSEGWVHQLINHPNLELKHLFKLPAQGKYIELERMLSSIVAFQLILDGSLAAYHAFTLHQSRFKKLLYSSFFKLNELAKKVTTNKNAFDAMMAILIYSDLGKTPKARSKASTIGIQSIDHDDWLEALFLMENHQISQVIPSFFGMNPSTKEWLKKVSRSFKVHLGHVLHLEGGIKMFHKLETALSKGEMSQDTFDFAFLVQMCDVAASQSHGNIEGFAAFIENTFKGYQIVREALEKLINERNSVKALEFCLIERGRLLGLSCDFSFEKVLIRLACMMRLYTKEEGRILKLVAAQLNETDRALLEKQFDISSGFNSWNRNPTYIPAVLVNLIRFHDGAEMIEEKLKRALNGALCIAKLLEAYSHKPEQVSSEIPLCFNLIAQLAYTNPELFNPDHFDSKRFELDEKNNLKRSQMKFAKTFHL